MRTTMCRRQRIAEASAAFSQECPHCDSVHTDDIEILASRQLFWANSHKAQNEWLVKKIMGASRNAGLKEQLYMGINSRVYCVPCFWNLIGIGHNRWYGIRRKIKEGSLSVTDSRADSRIITGSKRQKIVEWMEDYEANQGNYMPHLDEVHLPPSSWVDLTEYCNAELAAFTTRVNGLEGRPQEGNEWEDVTPETFKQVVQQEFPKIRIPPVQRMSKCDVCTKLKSARERTLDRTELKRLKADRDRHLVKVMGERRKYWKHRRKARHDPQRYCSIIIDGIDQAKTTVPFFTITSSEMSRRAAYCVKMHVIGALCHGGQPFCQVFFGDPRHETGSNTTLEVLMKILLNLSEQQTLPEVLYLQGDNCWRENKNQQVLAFYAMLVESGLFRKVISLFVPKFFIFCN
jgi:hypothetical protein